MTFNNIEKVFIQINKEGQCANQNIYNAWYGFDKIGKEIEFFTWENLKTKKLDLSKNTLIVGGIPCVYEALEQLGCKKPNNIDYPENLRTYLNRDVKTSTIKEIRSKCKFDRFDPPIFIKPKNEHKIFTGHVLYDYKDMHKTISFDPSLEIWTSDVVEFITEWRYFIKLNTIVGLANYRGDCSIFPDFKLVNHAVVSFFPDNPSTYVMDFGVLKDGRTTLVEVNEGFSFGCYGLNWLIHIEMLTIRWNELVNQNEL